MHWFVLLAVLLIVSYYFILKSKSTTMKKCFSFLSLIFFLLIISVFWSDKVINISLILPFLLGISGIILGWFGIKSDLRISLIGLNILALVFYLIVFLMATVGFQEP
ncbi:hypothetical protein [Oceanobacillus picturae]|uniref:hypothetical protein n=1 Tax=Oceanobacillus picturae TaxID=171693 RepID=UPI00073D9AD1|nr:hypothetical protein [Oceanobacillus picturae]